jgi:hypothetical protein
MRAKRRQYLIEHRVQLGLVGRLLFQWFTFLIALLVALPLFRALAVGDITTPLGERLEHAAVDAGIVLAIFVLLLPYFVYDLLKTTNRFCGPIYRLRRTVQALASGAPFTPIKLRKRDHWHDLTDEFNALMANRETAEEREAALYSVS